MKAIEKLISIAKQEIGYLEKASNKDLDSIHALGSAPSPRRFRRHHA